MMGGIPYMSQRFGMGGTNPSPTGSYVMSPGGGIDVMSTLKQNSNFATQYQGSPGSNPMSYGSGGRGGLAGFSQWGG